MQPEVTRQLGMEAGHPGSALAGEHGMAVVPGEHLDAVPARSMRGARMNTPGKGPPGAPSTSSGASNESRCRPFALRRTAMSMAPNDC